MKEKKLLFTVLCGIFFAVLLLFLFFYFFNSDTQKKKNNGGTESAENPKDLDSKKKIEMINLSEMTELEVITDCTKFIPAAQNQSYNFETDMNQARGWTNFTDMGNVVYLNQTDGGLFQFFKDTGSAGIACDQPGCVHDLKTAKGDCQANLHELGLDVYGLQYYEGDLYYALGGTMLYKMSSDRKVKCKYASLLGEKGFGTGDWLIHRGYIYFCAINEGIYKMPVENPAYKELLINIPGGTLPNIRIKAYGSYLYFTAYNQEKNSYAAARYNIESNQIEQFMDVGENLKGMNLEENEVLEDIIDLRDIIIHDGKLYYTESRRDTLENVVYQYDIASGKNEVFLNGEGKGTYFGLSYNDSDYIYIWKSIHEAEDYYDDGEDTSIFGSFVYTWDGELAAEIVNTGKTAGQNLEPLEIIHDKIQNLAGSDDSRIYYLSEESDWQVDEDGIGWNKIAGSQKVVISYINKADISSQVPIQEHIAGEISVGEIGR